MSIPFATDVVAKVWRRSWNRSFLHSALSNITCIIPYTAEGSLGIPSTLGDGNIHSESIVSLYSFRILTRLLGSIIVLTDSSVFGSVMTNLPFVRLTCLRTFSSPVSRFKSSHFSAISSPRRKPVDRATKKISKNPSYFACTRNLLISSGVSTCISLDFFGGILQPIAGFFFISPSSVAF